MALKKTAPDQAIEAFERAAALVPHATGPDSPQAQIAEVALAKGDKARAIKALDTLTGFDHTDLTSARKLATLLDPKQDAALLQTALRRAVAVDPFDSVSHTTLGRMALSSGDVGRSRADVPGGAGRRSGGSRRRARRPGGRQFEAGNKDEARRQALAALEIAPDLLARPGSAAEV